MPKKEIESIIAKNEMQSNISELLDNRLAVMQRNISEIRKLLLKNKKRAWNKLFQKDIN